jgi:tetratricopeptide (TPR) repeat protein
LESIVEPLGHPPEAVDVFLFAHSLIFPEPWAEDSSPVALSSEENRTFDRAAMAAGWTAGEIAARELRAELVRRRREEKIDAAKKEAERLFQGLIAAAPKERAGLVEAFPDYWNWALAVLMCEASVKSAAHKAEEALEWAELALSIAEKVPGEESWRSRVSGYCWAYIANARRVGNDFKESDAAFARAWELWHAGADFDPELLAEWRLFSLEASLRRDQNSFSAALKLLDQARVASRDQPLATARILLKKGNVFEQMGESESALEILQEATPFVEESNDQRLIFGLRFDTANNLHLLQRYEEAAELLPKVLEPAIRQANELDVLRVGWLRARLAAGQGRTKEAVAGLEQVRREFRIHGLPYDAALSSLDLALLWLEGGRTGEVKELAIAMGWIFKAKGIRREAIAALRLFCDAALQETATLELARWVVSEIEKTRRSASPHKRRDRG